MGTRNSIGAAVGVVVLCCYSAAGGAPDRTIEAPIKRVTVFQDQARITRELSLDLPQGDNTLLLERLPQTADEQSFRASASGVAGITIRALSVRSVEHIEQPQAKAAEVERQIALIERQQERVLNNRIAAYVAQKKLLSTITGNAGERMAGEVTTERLSTTQWESTLQFIGSRQQRIGDSIGLAEIELEEVCGRIDSLRSELASLAQPKRKRTRTVTVNLEMRTAGRVTFALEYMVPRASWKPLYDARLVDDSSHVELSYNAEISQQTGEDWIDVDLTLSTATPSRGVGPGEFMPRYLAQYSSGESEQPSPDYAVTGEIKGRVVDRETREPLVGASIRLAGTGMSAMTDHRGMFTILRVTPGTYTAEASAVGYTGLQMTNIAVTPGLIRQVNLEMTSSVTSGTDVIKVTDKQDVLNKFETSSQSAITAHIQETRPVQTVDNLLKAVQGVQVSTSGQVYMRAGRAEEVAYIVDGVPVSDPLGALGGVNLLTGMAADFSTANISAQGYAVSFSVPRKENIPSGEQTVRTTVARSTLTGSMKLASRPRNIDGAYRLVTVQNQGTAPLLPGKVAIFGGSDYLGCAELNQWIAPNQTFELPFGLDQSITVKRALVEYKKSEGYEKIQLSYTVGIVAANHGTCGKTIEIEESVPVSRDNRVKIAVGNVQPRPLSLDKTGKGIWSLTVPPGDSVVVSIPFRIAYPSWLELTER